MRGVRVLSKISNNKCVNVAIKLTARIQELWNVVFRHRFISSSLTFIQFPHFKSRDFERTVFNLQWLCTRAYTHRALASYSIHFFICFDLICVFVWLQNWQFCSADIFRAAHRIDPKYLQRFSNYLIYSQALRAYSRRHHRYHHHRRRRYYHTKLNGGKKRKKNNSGRCHFGETRFHIKGVNERITSKRKIHQFYMARNRVHHYAFLQVEIAIGIFAVINLKFSCWQIETILPSNSLSCWCRWRYHGQFDCNQWGNSASFSEVFGKLVANGLFSV